MVNPFAVVQRLAGDVARKRLESRVRGLPAEHLVSWAEASVPAIGRALDDWGREGAPEALQEARLGAASLLAVLEELETRRAAGRRT